MGNTRLFYGSRIISHWDLPSISKPKMRVMTFAAPKLGNKNFANFFDQRVPSCYQIIFREDPVPRLLHQTKLLSDYYHVGQTVILPTKETWPLNNIHQMHRLVYYSKGLRLCKMLITDKVTDRNDGKYRHKNRKRKNNRIVRNKLSSRDHY